jgi:ubiquinone/menaquinone biosynthesis C-methylase UbiE
VGQYDDVAELYEARIVPRFRPIAERLVRAVELEPDDRVLEVAAGTGGLSRLVASKLGSDGVLVVTDLSAPMLDVAERVLTARSPGPHGRPDTRTVVADLEQLPFPGATFDVVLGQMTPVLDSERGLAEAHRVLTPGGRLAIAGWGARYEETAMLNVARAAVGVEPYPVVRLRTIAGRLARAGFTSIRQRTRPMTARHASIDAYLDYRRAFGSVGYTPEVMSTYFTALEREVRRRFPTDGPIRIGWSITIVTAAKA